MNKPRGPIGLLSDQLRADPLWTATVLVLLAHWSLMLLTVAVAIIADYLRN